MAGMEIQNGGSLTVRELQCIWSTKARLPMSSARHVHTDHQPASVLTYLKIRDKPFESPFKSDVYFFSTRRWIRQRHLCPSPSATRTGAVRYAPLATTAATPPAILHTEIS
jgi:membrane protease subunit (stomatin/prohibitin family)